ncbi:hypothetical protein PR003_g24809 [Phytophthora rubi]|uniref:Uncharacterized protein n=1 Tax=Phytophthora rubi TaxID=129364 RepID=A0A6A3HFD9_9STRA|nr:hypothetical protein PR001_g28023 [Phytophthora rubi]KAE9292225.1 hypothetical protein PR003_g24809 [Phytophthora rubi]
MSSTEVHQQNSAISHSREPGLTLELSPVLYTAAWVFIVLFHAACGTFLICVAMAYWCLTMDSMPFFVSMWSLKGTENYRFYGVMFGIVGAMHGVRVLNIIVMSIQSTTYITVGNERDTDSIVELDVRSFAQIWNTVFSRQGYFGVESEHFSTVYALQELLVASSQTYQSYRASNLLPGSELNVIMVALLIINCWTTVGIQIFLRKSPQLGRVFTFTYNAIIGIGMVTIVPLLIIIPYAQEFNLQYKTFKNPNFMYDPVPFVTMVLENRLMFAAGMLDFTMKLIPHLSTILSLLTASELLGRGDITVVPNVGGPIMQAMAVQPEAGSSNIGKLTITDTQASTANSQNPIQWKSLRALLRWKSKQR